MSELITIPEASKWASDFLDKPVSTSNISYLIQYGRVPKNGNNGSTLIDKKDLKDYYEKHANTKKDRWRDKLGEDLNWTLSFSEYKESQTTKHVHRLHPYKGKFIPQLVEYFLDDHTDKFKKEIFFNKGSIVLDPFCGSGTTLIQANELGMHGIGVDISLFNSLISNSKVDKYNLIDIKKSSENITRELKKYLLEKRNLEFESRLLEELKIFNDEFFPSPEYRRRVRNKEFNEKEYGLKKEHDFLPIYENLVNEFKIDLHQNKNKGFLDNWYSKVVRDEIDFVFEQLKRIENQKTKRILSIILSRTIRSCRATTHSDLGTLKEPQLKTYYCKKHGKICKPLFSILSWWNRYSKDTIKRLAEFETLRTTTTQICLTGDSRTINIFEELEKKNPSFKEVIAERKLDGIFSSPPYVGLIDYHEQHAYAYDLFGFDRNDELEIGPLYKGRGKEAKKSYIEGISKVLLNCKKYLKSNYNVFLVANDRDGLYPEIAERAGMKIVNQFKRPVLNRVEKNRAAYSEIIFHLKENTNEKTNTEIGDFS